MTLETHAGTRDMDIWGFTQLFLFVPGVCLLEASGQFNSTKNIRLWSPGVIEQGKKNMAGKKITGLVHCVSAI